MSKRIEGVPAPLPLANVDTDVIMPKRFLRTITREGLADGTFADLRFHEDDSLRDDFVLNQPKWQNATILVVGDNFGCGSSREHAVWGLRQLGIKAIIGTGFAGIFFDNARKNGLALPIVSAEARDQLLQCAHEGRRMVVHVADRMIQVDDLEITFEMNAATQSALLDGRDDTLDSLKSAAAIEAYEQARPQHQRVSVIK